MKEKIIEIIKWYKILLKPDFIAISDKGPTHTSQSALVTTIIDKKAADSPGLNIGYFIDHY